MPGADRFGPAVLPDVADRGGSTPTRKERVFLETVWHLMEDAGYTREQLRGGPQPACSSA